MILQEDVEVGSEVLTMVADDADSGEYSILRFQVEGSEDFSIDDNGILIVARPLDRETLPVYSLVVKALDVDDLFCETKATITLKDINDSPPKVRLL